MKTPNQDDGAAHAIDTTLAVVRTKTGVGRARLLGNERNAFVSLARQSACWIMRHELSLSLPQIAKAMGRKHHGSVLHALRVIEKHRDTNVLFHRRLTQMAASVRLNLDARWSH